MEFSRTAATIHRQIKTQILGQLNTETKGKKMYLEHILRSIQKAISSLPDHFGIGVKMTSKNIFSTLRFWVEMPQILGLGLSVHPCQRHPLPHSPITSDQPVLA